MNVKFKQIAEQFIPFIVLGMVIALLIFFLVVFSYVVLWGLLIGTIIYLVMIIKYFFSSKKIQDSSSGRIIEHSKKDK